MDTCTLITDGHLCERDYLGSQNNCRMLLISCFTLHILLAVLRKINLERSMYS